MSRHVFTDKYLSALKPAPEGKRVTHWDGLLDNFGVRITDKGVVSFIAMRRLPGRSAPTRITIGRYPVIKLADARKKAGRAISELAEGEHPRQKMAAQQAAEAKQKQDSVAHVAERFLSEHADDMRTGKAIRQLIEGRVVAKWKKRPISSIKKSDIAQLVADVRKDVRKRRKAGGVETARQVLIYVKSMFAWAADMDIIDASPAASIKLSGKRSKLLPAKRSRERVLTDDEIKTFWRATEIDSTFDRYVRMLLILGCRRSELAGMKRSELDFDAKEWRLPADRVKNEESRVVFLPDMAVEILRALPEHSGEYVFSTTAGERPISGFMKLKKKLDERVKIDHWTLHDLRRTFRTSLSALGVAHVIAELCIGHRQRGVAAIYDRHRYEKEQREALDLWCARLRNLTTPPAGNVIAMPHRVA